MNVLNLSNLLNRSNLSNPAPPTSPDVRRGARGPLALGALALLAAVALVGCSVAREVTSGDFDSVPGSAPAPAVEQTKASRGEGGVTSVAVGAPAPPTDAPLPTFGEGRQIIRNGSADLEVRSVTEAFTAVQQIAASVNGTVADSSYTGTAEAQRAQITIRVPVARFDEVLSRLRDIATEVRSVSTGSSDVTDEYTDVEATLTNLRAVEGQYMQLLGRATTIGDVLQVQDRLNQVRLQIDRTEARRR